jgi:hypothetical protein
MAPTHPKSQEWVDVKSKENRPGHLAYASNLLFRKWRSEGLSFKAGLGKNIIETPIATKKLGSGGVNL